MFTSCPGCQRQFRIRAGQLSAARGTVRCGYCGKQFNAVERLTDKPLPAPKPARQQPVHEPELEAPEVIATDTVEVEFIEGIEEIESGEPEFDIPEILRDDLSVAPRMSTKARIFWSLGIFVLLVVGVAQAAWFNRDILLEEYPELRPWADKVCEKLQCEVIRQYKTSDIRLLNRDVRLHPNYADTLLVNATMANQADKTQPFPEIQFSLFDTNGKMIASRQFTPEEYLDNSMIIKDGMPPGQPVHFVLEVTGPTEGAVSFEFRFL